MFVQRVKEKEAELKDAEREVKRCRAVVIFGHPQTDDFHVNDHPFMWFCIECLGIKNTQTNALNLQGVYISKCQNVKSIRNFSAVLQYLSTPPRGRWKSNVFWGHCFLRSLWECFKKQKTLLQPSHYKYSNDSQVCVKFFFSPYTDNIGSLSLFSLLVPFSCRVVSSSWSASTPTRRRSWRRRSDFWTRTRAPSVKDEPPRSSCRPRVSLPMARRTRTARSKRLGFVSYLTNRYSHLVVEVEPRKWSRSRNETLGELNLSNAQRQKGNADLE